MVKLLLPDWAILAGGVVVAAAAFFTAARITHWAMSPRTTVVVVRPGPTVFVTKPAGHGHLHERALPIPPPGGLAQGGVLASPETGAAGGQRGQPAGPSPASPSPSPSPSPSALPTSPAPSPSASQTPTPPPSPSASGPSTTPNGTPAPSSAPASSALQP